VRDRPDGLVDTFASHQGGTQFRRCAYKLLDAPRFRIGHTSGALHFKGAQVVARLGSSSLLRLGKSFSMTR
jgi:hypothetical protein